MQTVAEILKTLDTPALTRELLEIPSYSFLENQEQAVAEHLYTLMHNAGVEVEYQQVEPGRPNVIARVRGGKGPSLMLCGHTDTVPAYDMRDAFSPTVEDGVLHGRGACDMKGAVAAMAHAVIAIKKSGVKLGGDLVFAAIVDEEEGGKGAEYLVKKGPHTTAAIIGEPTEMQVALGHKGLEWIRVDFIGKKVHGGSQDKGVNAIEMAARFVSRVYDSYLPELRNRTHPVLGHATINIGRIEGGDQPSTVAGECYVLLDRRAMLGETREQVYGELKEICDALHKEDARFSAVVQDTMADATDLPHLPYCVDAGAPVVAALSAALETEGVGVVKTAFPAWTDAGTLAAYTDTTAIVCGPGKLQNAHSVNDCVDTAELTLAARVYTETALRFLGVNE